MTQAIPSAGASLPVPQDDAALIECIRRGDAAAFERLMRRHNRRLYRVARALLRDAAEAEDALQEAYLSAYRALHAFRAQASLATWLTRIVVNECTTRLRRHARRDNIVPIVSAHVLAPREEDRDMPQDPHAVERDTPEHALMRSELRALIERRIDELPEDFRVVFILRSVEEASVEEVAQCLDVPEATVRTRHFRARSLLRESIARELDLAERDVFDFDGERCDRIVAGVLRRAQHA